jgi:hypothetical protein
MGKCHVAARFAFRLRKITDQDTIDAEICNSIEELYIGKDYYICAEGIACQRACCQAKCYDAGCKFRRATTQADRRRACEVAATRRRATARNGYSLPVCWEDCAWGL